MIYLYAITDAADPVPDVRGHGEAPLFAVAGADRGLHALCSRRDEAVEASEAALWRHEEVVEALMASAALLPMRFNTLLEDEAAVRALLAAGTERFRGGLEHVRGRVELGVRVLGPEAPPAPADGSGTAFFGARLAERRRGDEAIAAVRAALAPHAADARRRHHVTRRLLLNAAYLVARDRVEAFTGEVARLEAEHDDLTLMTTGPWPPYSFVPATEEAPRAVPA